MQISVSSRLVILLWLAVALTGLLLRYADLAKHFQANLALLNSMGWPMIKTVNNGDHETSFLLTDGCQTGVNGKDQQTQTRFENTRRTAGSDSCYVLLQSRLACLQGQRDRAVDWFEFARETCPRQEQVDDWAGVLAWTEPNRQKAINHWNQIKHSQTMMIHRAEQLIRSGNFEESQLLLETALPAAGQQAGTGYLAPAFENLGLAYQRQSNWSQAIDAYKESLRRDPQRVSTWLLLAITYRNNQQWNEARTAFQQALVLVPETDGRQRSIVFEQMGIMQQEQGRYDQAFTTFSEAFCLRKSSEGSTNEELSPLLNRLERLQRQLNGGETVTISITICPTQEE
jgi:tetratricopeptide (TPR) repeat protein